MYNCATCFTKYPKRLSYRFSPAGMTFWVSGENHVAGLRLATFQLGCRSRILCASERACYSVHVVYNVACVCG